MRRFIPSLSALQAFEASARHHHFTRAGAEIGMTQSGVSRQIGNLEAFLGVRLFERIGSRLALTTIGQRYFVEIVHCLDRLEEISIDAVRGRSAATSLKIGASQTMAAKWLAPRLGAFLAERSDVPIEIASLDDETALGDKPIDLAILRGYGAWPDTRSAHLFDEEIVVVASPRLVPPGTRLSALDFAAYPTLQNAGRPSLWLSWLGAVGVDHSGTIQGVRFANSLVLVEAVVADVGIAVVPRHFVARELREGSLHTPFGPPVRSGEAYWLVHPENEALDEPAAAFRNWLQREALKERGARADA
jgi:LysR family transcriptional regulator, glycine cleavage system transcriptional activator